MPHLPPQILLVQICRRPSPSPASPQANSFPEMNTCRTQRHPSWRLRSVLGGRVLICMEFCFFRLSSPNWAQQRDARPCSLGTTFRALLCPWLSGRDGSVSWESSMGVGMLMLGRSR